MDILGVKYIGFEKGELLRIEARRLDPLRYKKVWEKDNFIVFENKNAYSRVYLADRSVLRTIKQDSIREIYDQNIDLRDTVIASQYMPFEENKSQGSARILSYLPSKVTVETESDGTKILVLSDAYYPGWKAEINGDDTEIIRVNHAFRGVIVPKGKNMIVFSYQPYPFFTGILVTIISIAISLMILFRKKKNVN